MGESMAGWLMVGWLVGCDDDDDDDDDDAGGDDDDDDDDEEEEEEEDEDDHPHTDGHCRGLARWR